MKWILLVSMLNGAWPIEAKAAFHDRDVCQSAGGAVSNYGSFVKTGCETQTDVVNSVSEDTIKVYHRHARRRWWWGRR